jgi:hypothetical protein
VFPKINSTLKGRKFQDIEDNQKTWRQHWKLFHNRTSKNVSSSGSIVGLNAYLIRGSTSKVTPLSKLYEGVSKNFETGSITKYTLTMTLLEKQHEGLWRQNSLDWLTK